MTTPTRKDRWQVGRAETDRRLRLQLGIFSVVFAVVTALVVIRVVGGGLDPFWPLAGFALGLLIGVILARSKPLSWDAAGHEVVSSMSVFGIVVTVIYVAFMLARGRLIGGVVDDVDTASVTGLAITGGVMLGRAVVMFRTIRHVLTSAGRVDDHQAPGD